MIFHSVGSRVQQLVYVWKLGKEEWFSIVVADTCFPCTLKKFVIFFCWIQFRAVTQSCRLFATPWTVAHQAPPSITNSRSSPKCMSIESVMPSNHLILWCPLLLLPSIFPSIRVFSNESVLCIRWPKYWSFSFGISPSSEYSRLISTCHRYLVNNWQN